MIGMAGKPRMLILVALAAMPPSHTGHRSPRNHQRKLQCGLPRLSVYLFKLQILQPEAWPNDFAHATQPGPGCWYQGARTPFENRPFLCHVTLFKAYVAHVGGDLGRQNRYSIYIYTYHIHIIYIYIGYICCSQLTCYSLRAWKIASGKISTFWPNIPLASHVIMCDSLVKPKCLLFQLHWWCVMIVIWKYIHDHLKYIYIE